MPRFARCPWPIGLIAALSAGALIGADPPAATPPVLPLQAAVRYALENNPQLMMARTQRGIAAAGVVLARIYPFNPQLESTVLGAAGPEAAGVTNHVFNEHILSMQLEVRGQRWERRAAACAALTRTEWEIAGQELASAIGVIRAYNTVLYRQQKLQIIEQTIRLNEQIADRGKRLAEFGQVRPADLILANTELAAARAQRGQARTAVAVARADLRNALGTLNDDFAVDGELDRHLPTADRESLTQQALQLRPEIQARNAAITEAEAQLRLQLADRYGNPTLGARYEYNESRVNFAGAVLILPLPVINRKQGEIAQRQAELARAQADLRQTEFQVGQAVQAALARLAEARKWADEYPTNVLPSLRKAREDMERLFGQAEQGVDVLRVLGVQTNLLRTIDAYLDARFEVSQAQADLAAAIGDPALATGATSHHDPALPPPAPIRP
jgi:cobalt-zinc-cadmium efflux system outer membrane protein